jgi:hypothetical protein
MPDIQSSVTTTVGVKVSSRILFEIIVGGTSVLLDWSSARKVLADLRDQLRLGEVIRINVECVNSGSKVSNFPLSTKEVTALLSDLDWYVNA